MEQIRKAFISQPLDSVDFAQRGIIPVYTEADKERILADFDRMDCPEYREQFPIIQRPAKDSVLVDYTPAVCGEFIDMGLYLSGSPECWMESFQTPKKTINLVVQYSIYSQYTAAEAAAWLSEIVNLYYSLVQKYNVSLSVDFEVGKSKGGKVAYSCEIVGTGEYLNEARAQYIFSPLFYRLIMFAYFRLNKAASGFPATDANKNSYNLGPRKEGDQFIIPPLYNKFFGHPEPDFQKILSNIQTIYI